MLPIKVLSKAKKELRNWCGLGTSVIEISHRSKEFMAVAQRSEQDLRDLLKIPKRYKVLFCQGGARAQFAALPQNLLGHNTTADYIDGGYWAHSAINEAWKYCTPNVINVKTNIGKLSGIRPMNEWPLSPSASYVHYCPNETIDGIAIHEEPDFDNKVVIGDYSSAILSRPIDVSCFGMIYAAAQKNIGPAGLTLVIIREDLLGRARKSVPSILDYTVLAKHRSMFNTPPIFSWYLAGLVFEWLKEQGGLMEMQNRNQAKAALLYATIDNSDFYQSKVAYTNRSLMNVPFHLADPVLDKVFLREAEAIGLKALQGHREVGGMRASIYNAMPFSGVQALTNFMSDFEIRYG